MRASIVISCFIFHLAQSQIFENDLPVSLQPPPPQPQPKADFGSVIVPSLSVIPAQQVPPQIQPTLQGPPIPPVQLPPKPITHHAALFTAEQESKLPPNLLNPFYKNPRIAEQLAKQSWFEPGENLVEDRESEKISRDKIYYALKSAGLIRRRRSIFFQHHRVNNRN